ncbi:MAG: hypothetical protein RJQ00_06060 [Vicingaceae bacterium]
MKKNDNITIKVNQKLQELCLKYGVEPEHLMNQFQKDMVDSTAKEQYSPQLLAELYLTEYIAKNAKVDRSSVESVLSYLRSYSQQKKTKQNLPNGLSKTTKKILKECNYRKNHSKN